MSETILPEAARLVHGDRGKTYGPPTADFVRTGRMWGALLGIPDIEPIRVAMMMVCLKVSRECHNAKRDNRVDICGYAECAEMIAAECAAMVGQ